MNGTVAVGYRQFSPLDPLTPKFAGVVAEVGAGFTAFENHRFDVRVHRDLDFSYDRATPYYVATSESLGWTYVLPVPFDVKLNALHDRMHYMGPTGTPAVGDDVYTSYGAGFGYRLRPQFRLGVQADWLTRDSERESSRLPQSEDLRHFDVGDPVMTPLLLLFALQAPPGPQPPARPPATTTAQSLNADYRVGLQDRLNVTVLGIADFSAQNLLVENDGKFDYINLGRIQAQDRTVQEIQRDVRELLIAKQMHLNPAVTVDVAEFRSQMVYVSGAVKDPKGFKITGNETLMNVLAQAGFLPSSGSYVEVTRNKPLPSGNTGSSARRSRRERSRSACRIRTPSSSPSRKGLRSRRSEVPGTYEVTSNMTVLQLVISAGDLTERRRTAASRFPVLPRRAASRWRSRCPRIFRRSCCPATRSR